jgi:fucose permease
LLRIACGAENLAFFTSLATLMYGVGSILTPQLYSHLVGSLERAGERSFAARLLSPLVSGSYPWVSVYWVFSAVVLLTLLAVFLVRLPDLRSAEDEHAGTLPVYLTLFKSRAVVFYAVAVICYCACEQGNSNWLSEFLRTYHGIDPQTTGAGVLSWYWALLTAGCLAGMVLVKLVDSRKILTVSTLLAVASFSGAVFGGKTVALVCFPLIGLFESVLWPILIELALNSLESHHGALMGILMSSVIGGAIGPFVIGWLADTFGLRMGMISLYLPFFFMAYIGVWARPLVRNSTVFKRREGSESWAE